MFTNAINFIKEHFKNPTVYGTVIISTGIVISSIFSYLLQFFLGRMLSPSDYGTFNALMSLGILVGAPAAILGTALIKISSELLANNNFEKLTALFWKLMGVTLTIGFLVLLVFWLLSSKIAGYLNISDIILIYMFGLYMSLALVGVVPSAYLQGLLRFKSIAFSSIVGGFIRFLLVVSAVYFGFHLRGAFFSLFITSIVSILVMTILLKKNLTDRKPVILTDFYKRILSLSLPVFLIQFGMIALNNMDVILVKRFFDSDLAGYYSGTVTLGKIFLFGASMIATVMFPQVSKVYAENGDYFGKFKQFLAIQIVLVFGGLAIFFVLPRPITLLFFGERFLTSVDYLPKFSIFVGLYVLVNFLVMFFLAIEKGIVALFLVGAVAVQFILISFIHTNLNQIININIIVVSVLHLVLWLYYASLRYHTGLQTRKNY